MWWYSILSRAMPFQKQQESFFPTDEQFSWPSDKTNIWFCTSRSFSSAVGVSSFIQHKTSKVISIGQISGIQWEIQCRHISQNLVTQIWISLWTTEQKESAKSKTGYLNLSSASDHDVLNGAKGQVLPYGTKSAWEETLICYFSHPKNSKWQWKNDDKLKDWCQDFSYGLRYGFSVTHCGLNKTPISVSVCK